MDELLRPEIVNVETFFNEFVEYFGGELISKNENNLTDRENADYLFKDQNVIAELKCFQKDLFNSEEDIPRLFSYFEKWEKKGLIHSGDILKIIFGSKQIPKECYVDLLESCSKTIDRALHKANKQIIESKRTLEMPNAKGIVLLCNDGNYFIQNDKFLGLIANMMGRKYLDSEIDAFVYFTLNQVSTIPNSELDWNIWAPAYRNENDNLLSNFINELGFKFQNDFYTKKTGIEPSDKIITDDFEKGMNAIKSMKHIPKEIIYNKK